MKNANHGMGDVEVGHRVCYPAEFVCQQSISTIEKIVVHDA